MNLSILDDVPSILIGPVADTAMPPLTVTPVSLSFTDLDAKKRRLEDTRAALKREFFGIDRCIDAVITSLQTWYLLPNAVMRPCIVNLWGMTGVGKTALVRSLVSHLGMTDRFLEIQMDGFSSSTSTRETTISGLLSQSGIDEGQPGIILLDEFQRFRTIDGKGEDIKLERYPDVWMLLSDGFFPSDYEKLEKLIEYMDVADYWEEEWKIRRSEEEANQESQKAPRKEGTHKRRFYLQPSEADDIKRMLRLPSTKREIMGWDKVRVRGLVEECLKIGKNRPFDYSKCLVFVSGNLDEAYKMAGDVEDCDTSAEVFHLHTLKIGVPEIKGALLSRFRPEQIARLGNNHIVYPSLNESAYMSLIRRSCLEYTEQVAKTCGIAFSVDESVYREIYDNSVYPTQGTRPVFTSIHKLFGSPLSDAVMWALEVEITEIAISLDIPTSSLVFKSDSREKRVSVDFEIRARRKSRSADFNALVAVHEAGHAVVYAALFNRAPVEVAINVASFKGGYNLYKETFLCKSEVLDRIATSMAGIVAEEAVFGQELRSTGCANDVQKATVAAAQYVRQYAMDGYHGFVMESPTSLFIEDVKRTDGAVETIIKDQRERAQSIITENRTFLLDLSKELLRVQKMDAVAFVQFARDYLPGLVVAEEADVNSDYAMRLTKAT